MKIIAISMVKNEVDIIEFFVKHTLSFVDECIIFDHLSTDGTKEILDLLQKENPNLFVYTYNNFEYNQIDATNRLLYLSFKQKNADLVLPIDADEILVNKEDSFDAKNIRVHLEKLPKDICTTIDYFFAFRYNQEKFFIETNDSYFKLNKHEGFKNVIIPKNIFFKFEDKLYLDKGNHKVLVKNDGGTEKELDTFFSEDIHYNHFSIRSSQQRILKHTIGMFGVLTTHGAFTNRSIHRRRYFNVIAKTGTFPLDITPEGDFSSFPFMKDCKIEITHSKQIERKPLVSQILQYTEILASKYADLTVQSDLRNVVLFLLPYFGNTEKTLQTLQSIGHNNYELKTVVCIAYTDVPDEIKNVCKVIQPNEIELLHSLPYAACILCYPGDICNRIDILITTFIKNDCSILCCKNDVFADKDQNIYYNPIVEYKKILLRFEGNKLAENFAKDKRIISSGINSFILHSNIFKNVVTKEMIQDSFDNMKLYENLVKTFKDQTIYTIDFPLFFRQK